MPPYKAQRAFGEELALAKHRITRIRMRARSFTRRLPQDDREPARLIANPESTLRRRNRYEKGWPEKHSR
jgi:hypothetical protein